MSGSPWNFLIAETGIVARVKALSQAEGSAWARVVGTRKDLAAITEEMQTVPAVYVVYDGFSVTPETDETTLVLQHRWMVVLAMGNAQSQREAEALNQEAGPYMGQLLSGLHGFVPQGCSEALIANTPPRPYYSPSRFAYYPLLFASGSAHCQFD
ncbi:phage tail terminator protein [Burkholderia gladioli]|uniref:phage tail terminator protein n=1 Tax=Burkholderia gladioli TaxID=28095 RepID=UPI000CDB7182|nr:hypothetical protein [Burkholderia gladioli]POS08031.1 hypothetical protein C3Y08_11080 [Burkholderia gladioli]